MLFKTHAQVIEDLSESKSGHEGIVVMYVNAFGNKDYDGDISAPGSFDKTIKENWANIKHFLDHNVWDNKSLVGLPLEMVPDSHGLKVTSQLNLNKQGARDVFSDYKLWLEKGRNMDHSFGYNVIKRDTDDDRIILEYKMHEYSTISFRGANPLTPALQAKSVGEDLTEKDIIDTLYYLGVALKEGNYTDKRCKQFEHAIKQLTDSLAKPVKTTSFKPVPDLAKAFETNILNKLY